MPTSTSAVLHVYPDEDWFAAGGGQFDKSILGTAFKSNDRHGALTQTALVLGEPMFHEGPTTEASSVRMIKTATSQESRELAGELGFDYMACSVHGSGSVAKELGTTCDQISATTSIYHRSGVWKNKRNADNGHNLRPGLTRDGAIAIGDKYVSEVVLGAKLYTSIEISAADMFEMQSMRAEITGKLGVGPLSVEFKGKFEELKKSASSKLSIKFVCRAIGVPMQKSVADTFEKYQEIIDSFEATVAKTAPQDFGTVGIVVQPVDRLFGDVSAEQILFTERMNQALREAFAVQIALQRLKSSQDYLKQRRYPTATDFEFKGKRVVDAMEAPRNELDARLQILVDYSSQMREAIIRNALPGFAREKQVFDLVNDLTGRGMVRDLREYGPGRHVYWKPYFFEGYVLDAQPEVEGFLLDPSATGPTGGFVIVENVTLEVVIPDGHTQKRALRGTSGKIYSRDEYARKTAYHLKWCAWDSSWAETNRLCDVDGFASDVPGDLGRATAHMDALKKLGLNDDAARALLRAFKGVAEDVALERWPHDGITSDRESAKQNMLAAGRLAFPNLHEDRVHDIHWMAWNAAWATANERKGYAFEEDRSRFDEHSKKLEAFWRKKVEVTIAGSLHGLDSAPASAHRQRSRWRA